MVWYVVKVCIGNMDLFVVFGMLVVYGLSLWMLLCDFVYLGYLYFEVLVVIVMFVCFGKWFELCVKC